MFVPKSGSSPTSAALAGASAQWCCSPLALNTTCEPAGKPPAVGCVSSTMTIVSNRPPAGVVPAAPSLSPSSSMLACSTHTIGTASPAISVKTATELALVPRTDDEM